MKPVLSIIIPALNVSGTLGETLDSIQELNLQNAEVLLIDGNSSDNTVEIARAHALNNLKVDSSEDTGVYSALNRGVSQAQGEWLLFLGANDMLTLEFPRLLTTACDTPGIELVHGNVEYRDNAHRKVKSLHLSEYSSKLKFRNTLHHQGTLYHRSLFEDYRYDEYLKILADYDFNLRCFLNGVQACKVDYVVASCDANGLSKRFGTSLYKEEVIVKRKHFSGLSMIMQHAWVWMKYLYKNS